ncbi:RES family NAD+ phosphorylase [Chelativorans alearense]|uniref:RES family NAD+ phosphorylase n=1 Tax=Chelativorans alearense TaxID=2681495 RepID=UPI0013D8D59D|nr:RES family NAD+ phosphorylase [Chelativorans alearense]
MPRSSAPRPTFRLIPSKFPPIGLFDTVATAADLDAVMDLVGWTNDRLVSERIARIPVADRAFGKPNSSVIMASFLHVPLSGARFNAADFGAWYASDRIEAAVAEVGHHMRRETVATGRLDLTRDFRTYKAVLEGRYADVSGRMADLPDVYAPNGYTASQAFGETLRANGADGILYDSVRYAGALNAAAFRPRLVTSVVQTEHYRISVRRDSHGIEASKLNA